MIQLPRPLRLRPGRGVFISGKPGRVASPIGLAVQHRVMDSNSSPRPAASENATMKFSEFIVKDAVRPELAATDRDGVLQELVKALADAGALPESAVEEVVAALIKREKNGSTGFGKGVAVPHVKHTKVKNMAGA